MMRHAILSLLLLAAPVVAQGDAGKSDHRWLQGAEGAAGHLTASRVKQPFYPGRSAAGTEPFDWHLCDEKKRRPKTPPTLHLYSGTAGGAILLHALADLEPGWRNAASEADFALQLATTDIEIPIPADGMPWNPDACSSPGLYVGVAGAAFATRTHTAAIAHLAASATTDDNSAHWGTGTDIIAGAAGIGLYLLDTADANAAKLAAKTGLWLLTQATPTEGGGLKWKMGPQSARTYPNFSHGTSGVAFFLIRLWEKTKDDAFLDAAKKAAVYLESIAQRPESGGCHWGHHEEETGNDLHYVSWCHGPPGTARFYEALHRATGEKKWRQRVLDCGDWLLGVGLPRNKKRINGHWNVGMCCGTAGIGDFFLDLWVTTGDKKWLDAATDCAEVVLEAATKGEDGTLRWTQAEHRVRPRFTQTQTGWAQGSAGIGLFFLRLHLNVDDLKHEGWRFPDSPFATVR